MRHFLWGGDARYITRRQTSASSRVDEGFWMQSQLRVGLMLRELVQTSRFSAIRNIKLFSTIGKLENHRKYQDIPWVSPEYFMLYSPQDFVHLRVGRFEPVFGLRLPDHYLWLKSDLGFAPWIERDSVELMVESESQFLSVAGFQSTSSTNINSQMTGSVVNFDQILFETSRVGISAMNAEGQGSRTRIAGIHGTLSWNENLFSMFDLSRIWSSDIEKDVAFVRLGFEVQKGLKPFAQIQGRFDRKAPQNDQRRSGFGITWLPRPHFELMFLFEKTTARSSLSEEQFLLFHYYL
jgi:hypothetical protein